MPKTFSIDARFIRAAQTCQADSKDDRHYLRGILITPECEVVGTNGHILYAGQYDDPQHADKPDEPAILSIHGNIPESANTVTFMMPSERGEDGVCKTDNKKAFTFEVIDGQFPNWQRVIPEPVRERFTNGLVLDPTYLSLIPRIFGKSNKNPVQIIHGTLDQPLLVQAARGKGCEVPEDFFFDTSKMVIMPYRTNNLDVNFLDSEVIANQRVQEAQEGESIEQEAA